MTEITLSVDPRVYSLAAVKKTGYRLGDRCSAQIAIDPDGGVRVILRPKSEGASIAALEGDFWRELLDQDLRESIAEQTEKVRNLILAQAFSGVSMIEPEADNADYRDDPLGIGRSSVDHG